MDVSITATEFTEADEPGIKVFVTSDNQELADKITSIIHRSLEEEGEYEYAEEYEVDADAECEADFDCAACQEEECSDEAAEFDARESLIDNLAMHRFVDALMDCVEERADIGHCCWYDEPTSELELALHRALMAGNFVEVALYASYLWNVYNEDCVVEKADALMEKIKSLRTQVQAEQL